MTTPVSTEFRLQEIERHNGPRAWAVSLDVYQGHPDDLVLGLRHFTVYIEENRSIAMGYWLKRDMGLWSAGRTLGYSATFEGAQIEARKLLQSQHAAHMLTGVPEGSTSTTWWDDL